MTSREPGALHLVKASPGRLCPPWAGQGLWHHVLQVLAAALPLRGTCAAPGGETLNKLQEEKTLFSPLSQNPRASTLWERVDFEPEPVVDLDMDQRGCIVFPKSVGTDQISRISGAVTQRFLCCYHLPSRPGEEVYSPLPQGGALHGA